MKQTPREKLAARLEAGRLVASTVNAVANQTAGLDRIELQALALRIGACNEKNNSFVATEAVNFDTGETYEAIGTLWQCGSKLCPSCLAKQASRSRKKLREAIAKQTVKKGERYYFATLTIPNPNASLVQTRKIVNRAWELFRKRSVCVELIRGGVKTEEFTLTPNGFHYHLHFIWLSKYLLYNEVRRVWTECVEKAFREEGIAFQPMLKSGTVWIKLQPITVTERSIQEVCKYITKSDSWSKMRVADLRDIALIKRWFRMFELIGSFAPRSDAEPIVHTSNLTDGEADAQSEYWRDVVVRHGIEAYRDRLAEEIGETRRLRLEQLRRRWPESTIENLP